MIPATDLSGTSRGGPEPGVGAPGVGEPDYDVLVIGSGFGGAVSALRQVVLAGGPVGTQRLLHRCKAEDTLPRLSDPLGHLTRTNSPSILVVMQALDNSITVRLRSGLWGPRLTSGPGHGAPNPDWIPAGNDVARRVAEKIGGRPRGTWGELAGAPMTAHPIGGCVTETRLPPASWTPTTGSTGTRGCTWSTVRRCPRTSGRTRR